MIENWSETLQNQTIKALQKHVISLDGKLHMKHRLEGFGYFDLMELAALKFVLYRKGGEMPQIFSDEQAVVAAGWAID